MAPSALTTMSMVIIIAISLILLPFSAYSLMTTSPSPSPSPAPPDAPPIRAGYWPSWQTTTFPPSAIDLSYFTHVYYAFIQPNNTTFQLTLTPEDSAALPAFSAAIRPKAAALLSIGGASGPSPTFAAIVSTPSRRSAFINSTIQTARKYNLDGLDFDWEYPANSTQMSGLATLYREWRSAIDAEAVSTHRRPLLLTSAVYFSASLDFRTGQTPYPADAMARSLDWVSPMCFDYHGKWEPNRTGAHAALFDLQLTNLSTSGGIRSWLASGMPAGKMVMGVPLYGRGWRLKDEAVNGIDAPAVDGVGPGDAETGTMVYSEVVKYNARNNATVVYDASVVAAYSYVGEEWIGYDDPASVAAKVRFAKGMGLAGYFFWALGFDSEWSVSKAASMAWES